ncbi:MAG: NAD(P)/FAD-dependent oxidoreductase [Deltaproteobacteria bacterium]|nr:NAD(P)/FAD-dependent oxidoreductase [Deltaproteobacteria bacterium]MBW2333520.1 NAD(P)/FAD-dependent oxidoreductase [Deltaproteobacteria bacterium]
MQKNKEYDAIWFGGGAAGRFGAAYMKGLGGMPLIVEKEGLGGECHTCRCAFENYVSDQASMAELLQAYSGLSWYPEFKLKKNSMAKVVEVYRNVGQPSFHDAMTHQSVTQLGLDVAWGEGEIIDKNIVKVNGKVYKGKNLVMGTGSRPTMPDIPGTDLENVWTYRDHPEIRKDPKKLVIIGGGKIGMGKGAMFAPFDIDVTILEKYSVLTKWDWEIKNWVFEDFRRRGIKVYEGVEVKEIKGDGKVEAVVAEIKGKITEFSCDAVMLSVGLTPNSEPAMPLGVKIGANNEIVIDKGSRTNIPGIYAVGDVAGPPYFMAAARKRGIIAAKNIMGGSAQWDDSLPLPDHIYLPPLEATTVGLTEKEAREKYGDVVIIRVPWGARAKHAQPLRYIPHLENQGLPVCGRVHSLNLFFYGQNRNGLHKAIVDPKSRKYVGFHHVGDGAKTAFQYLSYLLQQGWTVDQMANLHEIFLNAEHFIQLSRLVAGQDDLKGYSGQTVTEDYTKDLLQKA